MELLEPAVGREPEGPNLPWGHGRSSHAALEGPSSPPQAPLPWILPSLFAAFNVVLLVVFSGLFFAFP